MWLLLWVWSNLPGPGPLDHARPGGMQAQWTLDYATEPLRFLAGWLVVAAAVLLLACTPLLLAVRRHESSHVRFGPVFVTCLLVWLLFGAFALAGDLLLHLAVRNLKWLEDNTWLLTVSPLLIGGLYQFTQLKHQMLDSWRQSACLEDKQAPGFLRLGIHAGTSGLGAFAPILLIVFALGGTSLIWAAAPAAAIAAESNLRAPKTLSIAVGLLLLFAALVVGLGGVAAVCAHDGRDC